MSEIKDVPADTLKSLLKRIEELETAATDKSKQNLGNTDSTTSVISELLVKQQQSEEKLESLKAQIADCAKDSSKKQVRFETEEVDLGPVKKKLSAMDEQINQLQQRTSIVENEMEQSECGAAMSTQGTVDPQQIERMNSNLTAMQKQMAKHMENFRGDVISLVDKNRDQIQQVSSLMQHQKLDTDRKFDDVFGKMREIEKNQTTDANTLKEQKKALFGVCQRTKMLEGSQTECHPIISSVQDSISNMVEEIEIQKTKIAKKISRIEGELSTQREVHKQLPKIIMDQIEPKLEAIDLFPDQLEDLTTKIKLMKATREQDKESLSNQIISLESRIVKELRKQDEYNQAIAASNEQSRLKIEESVKAKEDVEHLMFRIDQYSNDIRSMQSQIDESKTDTAAKVEQLEKTVTQVRLNNSRALQATNEAMDQFQKTHGPLPDQLQKLEQEVQSLSKQTGIMNQLHATEEQKVECIWQHLRLPSLSETKQQLASARNHQTTQAEIEAYRDQAFVDVMLHEPNGAHSEAILLWKRQAPLDVHTVDENWAKVNPQAKMDLAQVEVRRKRDGNESIHGMFDRSSGQLHGIARITKDNDTIVEATFKQGQCHGFRRVISRKHVQISLWKDGNLLSFVVLDQDGYETKRGGKQANLNRKNEQEYCSFDLFDINRESFKGEERTIDLD